LWKKKDIISGFETSECAFVDARAQCERVVQALINQKLSYLVNHQLAIQINWVGSSPNVGPTTAIQEAIEYLTSSSQLVKQLPLSAFKQINVYSYKHLAFLLMGLLTNLDNKVKKFNSNGIKSLEHDIAYLEVVTHRKLKAQLYSATTPKPDSNNIENPENPSQKENRTASETTALNNGLKSELEQTPNGHPNQYDEVDPTDNDYLQIIANSFAEIRQVINLLLSSNMEVILDNRVRKNQYNLIHVQTLISVLSKYDSTETDSNNPNSKKGLNAFIMNPGIMTKQESPMKRSINLLLKKLKTLNKDWQPD